MSDGILERIDGALASCAGKTFEHHVRVEPMRVSDRWRCTTCGTTGNVKEVNDRLWPLVLRAEVVREKTGLIPKILLPSESPSGLVGEFYGYYLYRVQGIERPMVAVPGLGG